MFSTDVSSCVALNHVLVKLAPVACKPGDIYGHGGVRDRPLEGERDERRLKGEERASEQQREERWHCEGDRHKTEDSSFFA